MTVKSDLQKAKANAESLKGSYALFAQSTKDQAARQLFHEFEQDMQKHIDALSNRLNYLEKNNPMYQQQKQKK